MLNFANFAKAFGTQTEAGRNLQWLAKNDPESFRQYQAETRKLADQNRTMGKLQANIPSPDAGVTLNASGKQGNQVSRNINNQVSRDAAAQTRAQLEQTQPYKRANTRMGRLGVKARGIGGQLAGWGGHAMTAAMVLPMLGQAKDAVTGGAKPPEQPFDY